MIGIGLICVEYGEQDFYKKCTINSIEYWSNKYQVTVLTNTPEYFLKHNCKTFPYNRERFNFHDKISFLGYLSKFYELAILVDTNKLPTGDITFDENAFHKGLHSMKVWDVTWEDLLALPKSYYWNKWDEAFKISNNPVAPVCERVLAIKRTSYFTQFVELIEEKYKPLATLNDRELAIFEQVYDQVAEGRAEGMSIALAAKELNFPLFCPSIPLQIIKEDLKRQYL